MGRGDRSVWSLRLRCSLERRRADLGVVGAPPGAEEHDADGRRSWGRVDCSPELALHRGVASSLAGTGGGRSGCRSTSTDSLDRGEGGWLPGLEFRSLTRKVPLELLTL